MWREDREQFNRLAKQIVRKSLGLWRSCVQTHSHTQGQWGLTFTRIRTPRGRVSVVVYYPPLPPPVWALYSPPGFQTLLPVLPSPVIGWMRGQNFNTFIRSPDNVLIGSRASLTEACFTAILGCQFVCHACYVSIDPWNNQWNAALVWRYADACFNASY